MSYIADPELLDLVDALVEAIDIKRLSEIDRVRLALEPFGAMELFDAELQHSGSSSDDEYCICRDGVL